MDRATLSLALAALLAVVWVGGAAARDLTPQPVPATLAEAPYDDISFDGSPEWLASLPSHQVTAAGQPAEPPRINVGNGARCEWTVPTKQAGGYVVSLLLRTDDNSPARFGYVVDGREYISDAFHEKGDFEPTLRAFRISVPAGQTRTRMFLIGVNQDVYFGRAWFSRVTKPIPPGDGSITELTESSYHTTLRRAGDSGQEAACVVLVPERSPEREAAQTLAARLGLSTRPETKPAGPFPTSPVAGLSPDTNLIVVSGPGGGPLAQALRRAGWFEADPTVPGPGGYQIRTVARPFRGKANVIVLSASESGGLAKAVAAFTPRQDKAGGEVYYDTFLVDVPGERWARLRPDYYRPPAGDAWVEDAAKQMREQAMLPRAFVGKVGEWGDRYWDTGDIRYAKLFRRSIFLMENVHAFGLDGSHMQFSQLMRAWDHCEEAPVFSQKDRLRITNYLLRECVNGREGFLRSYHPGYDRYSGKVRMRHNHQTILGDGVMQAYLYYSRLYDLGEAVVWKKWCDDLIANATYWGRAPENSPNYEPGTFTEVADMLHYQGLSSKGVVGTAHWPEAAERFLSTRDSFSLAACYGDTWDPTDLSVSQFFEIMRDDWGWPAAQAAIDWMIRSYRRVAPDSGGASEAYAYLQGSTEVGGLRSPSNARVATAVLDSLLGLVTVPMTEGYYQYLTGQVGERWFWKKYSPAWVPPYEKTADKIQYRSGYGLNDEYLMLETIGWAPHGHMDLGTIVDYCLGGHLWIVDLGYTNRDPQYHSTLEVFRDGKPAWDVYGPGGDSWVDFRRGPQMLEVMERTPAEPGTAGPFSVKLQAKHLAGATWVRTVSGGGAQPLVVEDTLTADEPGEYRAIFRLRLLGELSGAGANWMVAQKGASLPVVLGPEKGDTVKAAPWVPDDHAFNQGRCFFLPTITNDGHPSTLEWTRTVHLERGQTTHFRAVLGPLASTVAPSMPCKCPYGTKPVEVPNGDTSDQSNSK